MANLALSDLMGLYHCCTMEPHALMQSYDIAMAGRPPNNYWYVNNNASILVVCHLDHVFPRLGHLPYRLTGTIASGLTVHCPSLDDRLGAWIMLRMLPLYGIQADLLFCDNEETGRTTAEQFCCDHPDYAPNWIVELDRMGTDYVTYQYNNVAAEDALVLAGLYPGWGSYSDISDMDSIGQFAFNLGIGYYNNHTLTCHADLDTTLAQLDKLRAFYDANRSIAYPNNGYDYHYSDGTQRGYVDYAPVPYWEDNGYAYTTRMCVECGRPLPHGTQLDIITGEALCASCAQYAHDTLQYSWADRPYIGSNHSTIGGGDGYHTKGGIEWDARPIRRIKEK